MSKLLITFHGYGSNGNDLLFLKDIFASKFHNEELIQFAPNAPFKINDNSYQWFPIDIFDEEYLLSGVRNVFPIVKKMIESKLIELNKNYEDLILAGFSQGGALALHTAFRLPEKIHSVFSFSGGLINPENILKNEMQNSVNTYLFHGNQDKVLPHTLSLLAYKSLKKLSIPVKIQIIENMDHRIDTKSLEKFSFL